MVFVGAISILQDLTELDWDPEWHDVALKLALLWQQAGLDDLWMSLSTQVFL